MSLKGLQNETFGTMVQFYTFIHEQTTHRSGDVYRCSWCF